MGLKEYRQKRKFSSTPEPRGGERRGKASGNLRFVIQMHEATRLHYDFRLEMGGVYKSWAVPRGPSLSPLDQRLAVFVEDHPLEYGKFEGVIPRGNYGAGTVMIWDEGTYIERGSMGREDSEAAVLKNLEKGHLTFILDGHKLQGEFALIKLKGGGRGRARPPDDKAWLLVKKGDPFSSYKKDITRENRSVKTGRLMKEIAANAPGDGDVWLPKRKTHSAAARPVKKPVRVEKERLPPSLGAAASRPTARRAPASEQVAIPRRTKAMMPVHERGAPGSRGWIYSAIQSGTRAIAELERGGVRLYSRQLLPLEKKFPAVVKALGALKQDLVLDGEIADDRYQVFDVLYANGRDLRDEPLEARLKVLAKLKLANDAIEVITSGTVWSTALKKNPRANEGLARDAKSAYHSGTNRAWVRFPAGQSERKSAAAVEKPRTNAFTNLEKIYWPKEKITKGDLIDYYREIAPVILPHLKDRPQSLHRHPDGIAKPGFFQKDMTGFLPRWVKTQRIFSASVNKSIDYFLCQDEASLLYLANLGCIELNPWLSRVQDLEKPDFAVIDLDPDDNPFTEVIEVARTVHALLEDLEIPAYAKTSGSTGIHIAIPLGARYDYDPVREFCEKLCRHLQKQMPSLTSIERTPARRRRKIYLDFLQNRRGQTLAAPYCLRPRPEAPVSMPLQWKELTAKLRPEQFTISNALRRVDKWGDLWKPVLKESVDLDAAALRLSKIALKR